MWGDNLAEAQQAQQAWIRRNGVFLAAYSWKCLGRRGLHGAVRVRELADHERVGHGEADVEIDAIPVNKLPGHSGRMRIAVENHNPKMEFVVYFVWKIQGEEQRSFERIACTADGTIPRPPSAPQVDAGARYYVSHAAALNPGSA